MKDCDADGQIERKKLGLQSREFYLKYTSIISPSSSAYMLLLLFCLFLPQVPVKEETIAYTTCKPE